MKTHVVYLTIIITLLSSLLISNVGDIWAWFFNFEERLVIQIEEPMKLKHQESKEVVGVIYKGAILKNVDLDEMLGDIGDNNTYKLIIELEHPYVKTSGIPQQEPRPFYYGGK